MPEDSTLRSAAVAEDPEQPNGVPSAEENEIVKNVQLGLRRMTEFASTAKVAAAEATESQKLTAMALSEAQTKLTEITGAATQAVAAVTQITAYQAVIATKSEHIQDAQEH